MLTKDYILDVLKQHIKLHPLRVKNIYLYGSHCYGIATTESDYDLTVIAMNSVENIEHNIIDDGNDFNFHIQTPAYFQERLDWNDPKVFECLSWSNDHPIMVTNDFQIKVVNAKYRHAVSHINSNSFVKAKKKIQQGDIFIGQKSLYHALRIPMYATQIMQHGKIVDWECANDFWKEIKKIEDWDILKEKFQPISNGIMTEFRKLCPKI